MQIWEFLTTTQLGTILFSAPFIAFSTWLLRHFLLVPNLVLENIQDKDQLDVEMVQNRLVWTVTVFNQPPYGRSRFLRVKGRARADNIQIEMKIQNFATPSTGATHYNPLWLGHDNNKSIEIKSNAREKIILAVVDDSFETIVPQNTRGGIRGIEGRNLDPGDYLLFLNIKGTPKWEKIRSKNVPIKIPEDLLM